MNTVRERNNYREAKCCGNCKFCHYDSCSGYDFCDLQDERIQFFASRDGLKIREFLDNHAVSENSICDKFETNET